MPTTFNAQPLFSSGPHRVQEGPSGDQLLSNGRLFPTNPGSQPIGPLEPTVTVRGRLIATTEFGSLVTPRRHRRSSPIRRPSPISPTTAAAPGPTWTS